MLQTWIAENALAAILIVAVACGLISTLITTAAIRRAQRKLTTRLRESYAQQSGVVEAVNAVMQMSASSAQSAGQQVERLSDRLDARMDALIASNEVKLDQMRRTVDEQLTTTLNQRLGHSFQQVSTQLEQVYKGLGEMQTLASGVGDLKRVLQGVKTRGVWGEVQLGALLEDLLTPSQYEQNAQVVKGSQERVEFAVKLPGQNGEGLLLPIDSKFPMEDYVRLIEAGESGDRAMQDKAAQDLSRAITEQAKKIAQKYIKPPATADFAVMFLPVESLYAEVIKQPGLAEGIQQKFRVIAAGPSTLAALLNSLRMGFRTLAIEQRNGEIWALLGTVKAEFYRFGDALDKTRQKLEQATGELDTASSRSRAISRKLESMEEVK